MLVYFIFVIENVLNITENQYLFLNENFKYSRKIQRKETLNWQRRLGHGLCGV